MSSFSRACLAVGKCFDCKLAINWRMHYESSNRQYILNDDVDSWHCPGGASPPTACPSNEYTHSPDWSTCVCPDGKYPDPTNILRCLDCTPGHYCTLSRKIPCARHYYQDEPRASQCKLCASSADNLAVTSICNELNQQLGVCDAANLGSQNRSLLLNCIECSKCRVTYRPSSNIGGLQDCYRSTQIK